MKRASYQRMKGSVIMTDKKEVGEEDSMTTAPDTIKKGNMKRKDRRMAPLRVRRNTSGRLVSAAKAGGARASSVLSSRGQIVIPIEIRNVLKAEKGDRVVFRALDDHTMVVRIEKKPTSDDLFGILKAKVQPAMRNRDWDEIRQIAQNRKAEEYPARGHE